MTDDDSGEVSDLERAMDDALLVADVDWLGRHWHPNALYVHLSGRIDSRDSFIERVRGRELVHVARETGDVQVRVFGEAAVVTGWARSTMVVADQEKQYDTRFTRVYVRGDEGWQMVSSQSGANTAGS
jgi:hypothetical protein